MKGAIVKGAKQDRHKPLGVKNANYRVMYARCKRNSLGLRVIDSAKLSEALYTVSTRVLAI